MLEQRDRLQPLIEITTFAPILFRSRSHQLYAQAWEMQQRVKALDYLDSVVTKRQPDAALITKAAEVEAVVVHAASIAYSRRLAARLIAKANELDKHADLSHNVRAVDDLEAIGIITHHSQKDYSIEFTTDTELETV